MASKEEEEVTPASLSSLPDPGREKTRHSLTWLLTAALLINKLVSSKWRPSGRSNAPFHRFILCGHPWRPDEGVQFPRARVIGVENLNCGLCLLPAQSSLQPPIIIFLKNNFCLCWYLVPCVSCAFYQSPLLDTPFPSFFSSLDAAVFPASWAGNRNGWFCLLSFFAFVYVYLFVCACLSCTV